MKNLCVFNVEDYAAYVKLNANFKGCDEAEMRCALSKKRVARKINEKDGYEFLINEGFKGCYTIYVTHVSEKCNEDNNFVIGFSMGEAEKRNLDNIVSDLNHTTISNKIAAVTKLGINDCWKLIDDILYSIRYVNSKAQQLA